MPYYINCTLYIHINHTAQKYPPSHLIISLQDCPLIYLILLVVNNYLTHIKQGESLNWGYSAHLYLIKLDNWIIILHFSHCKHGQSSHMAIYIIDKFFTSLLVNNQSLYLNPRERYDNLVTIDITHCLECPLTDCVPRQAGWYSLVGTEASVCLNSLVNSLVGATSAKRMPIY